MFQDLDETRQLEKIYVKLISTKLKILKLEIFEKHSRSCPTKVAQQKLPKYDFNDDMTQIDEKFLIVTKSARILISRVRP